MNIDIEDEDHEPAVFGATIEKATDAALLVLNHEANETHWVPRTLVSGGDMMDEGEDVDEFELAYFKAEELGWA